MSKKYLRGKLKEGFQNVDYKSKGIVEVYSPLVTGYQRYWSNFDKNKNSFNSENKNLGLNKMRKNLRKTNKRKFKKRGIVKRGIPRTLQPANKLIRVKMTDYQYFNCTAGAIAIKTFSGTNIVDPLDTASVQQPLGYDQWKAMYRTAYVVGMKVRCTLWNNQTTALMYGITMCDKNQGTTALTNYEYYKEVPKTVSRLLSPDVDHGVLTNAISTKKALHVKDIKDNDGIRVNLQSDSAPSEQYYAHVWVQPVDQTTALSQVQAVLDVEYIVLLTNPIIPSRSTG